jgi:DeoR/GlpR family transcriptional regulator of sugar metabolism
MLVAQRQDRILEILDQAGTVAAADLSDALDVSTATIRRDLTRLELAGTVERIHGGARLVTQESDFAEVMERDVAAKEKIAEAAAGLVNDGDIVLLDIGPTTHRIAQKLLGRHVTVVTTSLAVIDTLREDTAAQLVAIGGVLRRNFRSFVGPLALDGLATIRADVAFLSCTGVRDDGSIVDDISDEAVVKKALMSAADRVVLVATAGKFPGTGSLRIGNVAEIDGIITETRAKEAPLALAARAGREVITV